MSSRAATILAIAAAISSLCYAGLAQVPEPERKATQGAIVVGPPPIRLEQELPGRYQLHAMSNSAVIVIDTHTGHCWSKFDGQQWRDWGSPVKQK